MNRLLLNPLLALFLPIASTAAQGAFKPDKLPETWPEAGKTKKAAKKPGATKDAAALRKLLGDASVTLVRAGKLFLPGKLGKTPRIVDGKKSWLAYRAGGVVGLFAAPDQPLEIAANEVKAKMLDFSDKPDSFAGPGLCDADSRWFVASDAGDLSVGAKGQLEIWQEGWKDLVLKSGITTVFVPAGGAVGTSGPGVLVKLDPEKGATQLGRPGASYYQLERLATRSTNLTRGAVVKSLRKALEGAKNYKKADEKWKKDFEAYQKKRKDFLAHYKKNPLKAGEEVKAAPARPTRRGRGRGRIPRTKEELEKMLERVPPAMRDRIRKQMEARMKAAADKAKADAAKAPKKTGDKAKPDDKKKAPPRPKYPKKPKHDRTKEALLRILDGKTVLRIEAHRAAEIKAVTKLALEFKLPRIVLVGATEAFKAADELRKAGALVVITPQTLPRQGMDTLEEHFAANAAKLAAAGVPVAFGSRGKEQGAMLSLYAARSVAHGMPEAQALQALTQNAIDAAGTSKVDTGMVVFSANPLSPTAHVLCLIRGSQVVRLQGDK
ncbi:MAG: hypothetical protein QGG14_05845 [Planctomycetota bacterium]|jgi:ribosomal protein S17|nr:hypothetical protein [Planctomycetota bacterium]